MRMDNMPSAMQEVELFHCPAGAVDGFRGAAGFKGRFER